MDNEATRARLIGTWKLVSVINENVSTGKKADFFGPNRPDSSTTGRTAE